VAELWRTKPLTVVYGPPGTGKSSLLHAGVVPRLRALGSNVLPIGMVARGPVSPEAAAPSSNPFVRTLLRTWAPGASLPPTAIRRFLRDAGRLSAPVLVAVDQAEDLFRGDRAGERRELLGELTAAPRVNLLLCVRDDRFATLLSELGHPPAEVARFALGGLPPASAVEAVRRPLEGTGRMISTAVAEALVEELLTVRLVDEIGGRTQERLPAVVPWHLQVVCARIWEAWPAGRRTLTEDRLPDVNDALQDGIWAAVGAVAGSFERDPARLARWLARTFISPAGAARAVDGPSAETAGVPAMVLDALVDRFVLRVRTTDDGTPAYTPQSDRLLEPLGRLAERVGTVEPPPLGPADQLRAAADALADGDYARADRGARQAAATASRDLRLRIDAQTMLGNNAFARGDLAMAQDAYQRAVMLLETRQDQEAVGAMLAAIGRLSLERGDLAGGLGLLRSAVARLPADRVIKTELARALADAGEPAAAAAMLGSMMTAAEDDDARILHGRIRAQLAQRPG
jgi:tetratricopeptide (TPR) repeat protein